MVRLMLFSLVMSVASVAVAIPMVMLILQLQVLRSAFMIVAFRDLPRGRSYAQLFASRSRL